MIITKKINDKVMTMIISGAIVAGAGTYAFAAQYNQPVQQDTSIQAISSDTTSIDDISSMVESLTTEEATQSTVNSTETPSSAIQEVTNTDTEVDRVKQAADAAVSQINEVKQKAVQEVQQAASSGTESLKKQEPDLCAVINPTTGELVSTQDPNYETYKLQLGGDAGTVPPSQSTACQNALKLIQEKQASESSTASVK